MNETALLKLKIIVERAVRLVKAPVSHKNRMREELLAHVTGIFDEELSRGGDETAALIQAETRFGSAPEISQQLQQSVPKMYRPRFMEEQLFQRRSGESPLNLARRYSIWAFVWQMGIFQGMSLLDLLDTGMSRETVMWLFWQRCYILSLIAGSTAVTLFVILLMADALRRSLFVPARRSFIRAGLIGIVTSLVSFVPPLVFDVGSSPVLVRDRSLLAEWDITVFLFYPLGTLLMVTVLAWMIQQTEAQMRLAEDWDRLQIE